ncbi:MAG: hypothetical protein KQI62_02075 [Deltaproteobacteria bacterium]|nr:hypothetical protein [Deltaproteobacteria bacterium]
MAIKADSADELFPSLSKNLPSDEEVEITIIGPGYGESIILNIPGVGVGIIDSCQSRINDTNYVLPLEYLKYLYPDLDKISFLLLTHPHKDHYLGLDSILQYYRGNVQRVCWYAGHGTVELKKYLARERIAGYDKLEGFIPVLKAMEKAVAEGATGKKLTELTNVVMPTKVYTKNFGWVDTSILALSPSFDSERKYTEALFNSIAKTGEISVPIRDSALNRISVVLLIHFGQIKIVLGGDLEVELDEKIGWKRIYTCDEIPSINANIFKVSHHGSENGFYEPIWEELTKTHNTVGLIAPFDRTIEGLPTVEQIKVYQEVCDTIYITSSINNTDKLHRYYKKRIADQLRRDSSTWTVIDDGSAEVGYIRIWIKPDGEVSKIERSSNSIKL